MQAAKRRRSLTWQHSLLLLIFGVVASYSFGINLNIWDTTVNRFQGLYLIGFFAGVVAFVSGVLSFVAIAMKAVIAPIGTGQVISNTGRTNRPRQDSERALVARQTKPKGAEVASTCLRFSLAAVMALATMLVLRNWGWPRVSSSYGRYYWLNEFLTLLVSQLPFAIAFVRIGKGPDRVGLALAMVAGILQALLTVVPRLQYTGTRLATWAWLSGALGVAVVVFAYLVWRSFLSVKNDGGLLISLFFGLVAYTWLAKISLGLLRFCEQRWIYRP
jgi:hypothetical protein